MLQSTQSTQEIFCKVAGYEEKFPQSFLLKCQDEGIEFEDDWCNIIIWSFDATVVYYPCNKEAFDKAVTEFKGDADSITISKQQLRDLLSMSMFALVKTRIDNDEDSVATALMDRWEQVMQKDAMNTDSLDEMQAKWLEMLALYAGE